MKVVDLFCGTGGFSRGAHAAGLDVTVAVDVDPVLTSSYHLNFPGTKLLLKDIATLEGPDLVAASGGSIDGIIGGPPCQAFSLIGRRESDDPRRDLLRHFYRVVSEVKPKFFVMENVLGLIQGEALEVLQHAMDLVSPEYQLFGPMVLDAADYGAATKRKRCFVVGIRNDLGEVAEMVPERVEVASTVRDAIADLAHIGESVSDEHGFDRFTLDNIAELAAYASQLRADDGVTTGNVRTRHTKAVEDRFKLVEQGKVDPVGRHQRLAWEGQAPTLRAGTGADRGSFQAVRPLHPTEPRVITVREAARLQGFPDSHLFHPTIWHSFRMIGNSVSPPLAHAVLKCVVAAVSAVDEPVG